WKLHVLHWSPRPFGAIKRMRVRRIMQFCDSCHDASQHSLPLNGRPSRTTYGSWKTALKSLVDFPGVQIDSLCRVAISTIKNPLPAAGMSGFFIVEMATRQ